MRKPLLDRQLHNLLPRCDSSMQRKALHRFHHKLMKKNGCERKHDAMVLTVAFFLLKESHKVKVEYRLPSETETLYADILAEKDGVTKIFELELFAYRGNFVPVPGTGYYRRLSKAEYFEDRIIGKIARYWQYADSLFLVYALSNKDSLGRYAKLFEFFHLPLEDREEKMVQEMTLEVGDVYVNPKIPEERVRSARLTGVYEVDISKIIFEPISA